MKFAQIALLGVVSAGFDNFQAKLAQIQSLQDAAPATTEAAPATTDAAAATAATDAAVAQATADAQAAVDAANA